MNYGMLIATIIPVLLAFLLNKLSLNESIFVIRVVKRNLFGLGSIHSNFLEVSSIKLWLLYFFHILIRTLHNVKRLRLYLSFLSSLIIKTKKSKTLTCFLLMYQIWHFSSKCIKIYKLKIMKHSKAKA